MRFLILFAVTALLACNIEAGELKEGRWSGMLDTGNGEVNLLIDYENNSARLSIPEQGLVKVPVTDLVFKSEELKFNLNLGTTTIRFEGKLNSGLISGKYLQNGITNNFSLRWSGEIPPEIPVDIMVPAGEDKMLSLPMGSLKLSGRLRIPFIDKQNWAALIIPGSGPTNGDGNSSLLGAPNNSLLRLSNFLALEGIPSVRIDKRGTGTSASAVIAEEEQDFDDFIEDAEGWLGKLKELYPNRKILIIGHSQGGLVGMLAANSIGCDAFISIAAPGFPIDITLERQIESLGPEIAATGSNILSELRKGKYIDDVPVYLNGFFRPSVQPFLITYMQHDPSKVIKKADYPVLLVQGKNDSQTGLSDAENLFNSAKSAEIIILPLMNHLLRDVNSDLENRATYGEDRLPLSEGLKTAISDFLDI